MKTQPDCITCSICGVMNLFKKGILKQKYQEPILREILKYYAEVDYNQAMIGAARRVHHIVREVSGVVDPYKELKDEFNQKALQYYQKYKPLIEKDSASLQKAMRLAIAGNVIDFGPTHDFDMGQKIEEVLSAKLSIDDSAELFEQISKAKSILYLADNTGEIVFDKLFLETMNHPNVTLAVRHSPVLNDATMDDVKFLGLDKVVAKVITNGDNAPGTFLEGVSQEFLAHFNSADLIISKGQGNFEGLHEVTDKNIFFLLTLKCHIIAEIAGAQKGGSIVKSALKTSLPV